MESKKNKITHKDVSKAIAHFKAKGGIIHKLPEHRSIRRPTIGSDKYDSFESLGVFLNY